MTSPTSRLKVTLLAGGVGAARLLRGLSDIIDPANLTVVVNTGDDEEFYGLHVSPDLDTIVYTLAGLAPERQGWGVRGDTFATLSTLEELAGPAWFRLGDRDLATHLLRTERLRSGWTLSRCTRAIADAYGLKARVLPATDDRLRTIVHTARGPLAFQEYLVRLRARPRVERIEYRGARKARPSPGTVAAIERADAVLIAPSNPFVSIGPILAVGGLRRALAGARERTVAVSPLINGRAVKGPLVSMLRSLGHRPDSRAIAEFYRGLAAKLVVAPGDRAPAESRRSSRLPQMIEHDILIRERAVARRLARFAIRAATGA